MVNHSLIDFNLEIGTLLELHGPQTGCSHAGPLANRDQSELLNAWNALWHLSCPAALEVEDWKPCVADQAAGGILGWLHNGR